MSSHNSCDVEMLYRKPIPVVWTSCHLNESYTNAIVLHLTRDPCLVQLQNIVMCMNLAARLTSKCIKFVQGGLQNTYWLLSIPPTPRKNAVLYTSCLELTTLLRDRSVPIPMLQYILRLEATQILGQKQHLESTLMAHTSFDFITMVSSLLN
jgi:hypothetical protein